MQAKVNSAIETLEEAYFAGNSDDQNGAAGMLFTGGKDSMIMLHLWREHLPTSQPPLLVVDTYNQFDEIYDFRKEIAEEWELTLDIRSNQEFLEEVIWSDDDERDFAWDGPKTEGCCGALKIEVMGDFIEDGYDPLIVGRRSADINGELPRTERKNDPLPHERYHPLYDWSDKHVEAYIKKHHIPLPDVYYEGYNHTDCVDCVSKGEEGDDWSGMSEEQKQQLNQLRDMGYM